MLGTHERVCDPAPCWETDKEGVGFGYDFSPLPPSRFDGHSLACWQGAVCGIFPFAGLGDSLAGATAQGCLVWDKGTGKGCPEAGQM